MIKITGSGGNGKGANYREFMISGAEDVKDLPNSQTPAPDTAEAGSIAYTQDMAHMYMLGADDEWREV